MRVLLVAAAIACGTFPHGQALAAPTDQCGAGDLDQICEAARVAVTVGPNPLDAPVLDANTTYAVAGFAANKRGYLVLETQDSGTYTLYIGGPPATARICDEPPTCTSGAGHCMHSSVTYVLAANERYEIELGPIPSGQRVLVHVYTAAGDRVVRAGISASASRAGRVAQASRPFASTSRRHIRPRPHTTGSRTPSASRGR